MKRRKRRRNGISIPFVWLLLLLLNPLAPALLAQHSHDKAQAPAVTSRAIEGAVLSRSGARLPGAVVLIKDLKSLQIRSYIVQDDGKYHFYGLSNDVNYQLRAQFKGVFSSPKTVAVFDSRQKVVLNLIVAIKPKP